MRAFFLIAALLLMGASLHAEPGKVPEGFLPVAGTEAEPYSKTGWAQEIIHEATGIHFVFIPAGTFEMGSPATEIEREADEGPQHQVTVSAPFYLGKYEVTQAEWTAQMGENPSFFKGDDLPVEATETEPIQEFLSKLNKLGPRGFRLPTEREWEYACRAGTTTTFAYGDTLSAKQANFNGSLPYNGETTGVYKKTTVPVGSYPANAWGLHDMHGNVEERCQSTFSSYTDEPANAWEETEGPWNVFRGGGWYMRAAFCRSANRYKEPSLGTSSSGFRLLFTP